ncbi:MAG: HupE/UreJ family protein [Chitinophagales bacterium]|nr:HupE/UreJ family protein [Chitinophagales bacterium]
MKNSVAAISIKATLLTVAIVMAGGAAVYAHSMNYDFSKMSRTDIGLAYLLLGFRHIIPAGADHMLFILSIFLLSSNLTKVIWQATAFTIAHSITLGLAMYGLITPPSAIVEPVIALSIVLVAFENIITAELHPWRIFIIFLFGLVHGMGFASVLIGLGLPQKEFLTGLITFNIGVELGQITIILLAYFLFGKWFGQYPWYRKRIVIPLSCCIAVIAMYWTVERLSGTIG